VLTTAINIIYKVTSFYWRRSHISDHNDKELKAHHGEVNIGGIELQVDLLVNSILTVLVVVLTHLGSHLTEDKSHTTTS